jgi:hypothetical protein
MTVAHRIPSLALPVALAIGSIVATGCARDVPKEESGGTESGLKGSSGERPPPRRTDDERDPPSNPGVDDNEDVVDLQPLCELPKHILVKGVCVLANDASIWAQRDVNAGQQCYQDGYTHYCAAVTRDDNSIRSGCFTASDSCPEDGDDDCRTC